MKMDIEFPDDLLKGLLESDFETIAREALTEAAPALLDSVKSSVRDVITDPGRTELVDSFRVWSGGVVTTKTNACMLGVSPTGKPSKNSKWSSQTSNGRNRERTTTNNDIAWWLEKGSAHQPARPYLDAAAGRVRDQVLNICQKAYDRRTGAE